MNKNFIAVLATALALALPCTSTVGAQQCSPGPRCLAAGERSKQYVTEQQARQQRGGAAESAAASYCISMVVADISRLCGDEMKAQGQAQCASQAYQQYQAIKEAADGAKVASAAMSSWAGRWQGHCGWQE